MRQGVALHDLQLPAVCTKRRYERAASSVEAFAHGPAVLALPKIPMLARKRAVLGDIMLFEHYRENLRAVVGFSAAPYGYTLAVWAAGAALVSGHGLPNTGCRFHVRGWSRTRLRLRRGPRLRRHIGVVRPREGPCLLWGNLHFVSVGLSLGAATLAAYFVKGFIVWPLGGF